ncbi:MAG TPA: hypothetical protein VMU54_07810 [Planctomycetota bacterium]|nr:hypothetical protein [Planctomycetota bacterium]
MKIVMVILVVIPLVFAVGAWAAFRKPKSSAPADPEKDAKSHEPGSFEGFLAGLSLPTGGANPLKKSLYHAGDPDEVIGKAEKIRQVKLRITHADGCSIPIEYTDNAPHDPKLSDQQTHLPRTADEGHDSHKDETTLVLMKTGGILHVRACTRHKSGCPARIEVVK